MNKIDLANRYFSVSRFRPLLLLLLLLLPGGCGRDKDGTGSDTLRTATVTYIVDGDTIWVNGNEKIRYIGVDTPEIGECYYEEAKLRNMELVSGKTVTLEVCAQSPTDKYGRTLAYVYVDGILVNSILLIEGYARILEIPPCTSKATEFSEQMNAAKDSGAGLWSACQ